MAPMPILPLIRSRVLAEEQINFFSLLPNFENNNNILNTTLVVLIIHYQG